MNKSINDWVKQIGVEPIPVLNDTISDLKRVIDAPNAHVNEIVAVVERDPGLTVFLLRMMNNTPGGSLSSEVSSVQQALMMMGTDQLSELPKRLPNLEQMLQDPAKTRLLKTFSRTYHAARQAFDWASSRRDMTPDEVFAATQLHFLGEMALAIHAPELLDQVDHMRQTRHIASEEAQYIVLGFTLDELTLQLAEKWQLPSLVKEALHPENANFPRAYGIMLAVQLARGAAIDWHDDKTLRIEKLAAEWLTQEMDTVVAECHQLAVEIARDSSLYQATPAAARLPMIFKEPEAEQPQAQEAEQHAHADICLTPQLGILKALTATLLKPTLPSNNAHDLITLILKGMHDGIGLNRVVFARFDRDHMQLTAESIIGAENDPLFNRFAISLREPHLFRQLMKKTQAIIISDENRNKFWKMVPEEFQKRIGTNSFVAMSVVINNKPIGLFYADRHTSDCQLDNLSYKYFKSVCTHSVKALQRLPRLEFEAV